MFIIASNSDGYGVDRCLASGATCGAAIATAMIPFLLFAIMISWFGLQRRKWQQGGSDD